MCGGEGGKKGQGCPLTGRLGSLPHRRGGLAVADVIEAVLELLPGDRGAVGPEAFAGDYPAEGVVLIDPVGGDDLSEDNGYRSSPRNVLHAGNIHSRLKIVWITSAPIAKTTRRGPANWTYRISPSGRAFRCDLVITVFPKNVIFNHESVGNTVLARINPFHHIYSNQSAPAKRAIALINAICL